jgi:hypothetical protein
MYISYEGGRKDASFVRRVGYPAIANLRRTGERPFVPDFPVPGFPALWVRPFLNY